MARLTIDLPTDFGREATEAPDRPGGEAMARTGRETVDHAGREAVDRTGAARRDPDDPVGAFVSWVECWAGA